MVSRALIVSKVNFGLGKAGTILGYQIAQYRPTSTTAAIASGNLLGTLTGDFDSHPALDFTQQPKIGAFPFFFLGDPTSLHVGDYLVGQGTGQGEAETFFVAAVGGVEPAMCVRCNRVVTLKTGTVAPSNCTGAGLQPYGGAGATQASEKQAVLTGWPASILQGTKGEANPAGLPGDVRAPWVAILMPVLPGGLTINTGDQITDDLSRTFTISSTELTASGWRLTAMFSGA